MPIDPQEIETRTFNRSWRGLDPDEVRVFLHDIAQSVRDDDDYERAGTEMAAALRRMHELVTTTHDTAEHEAATLRRQAIVDAESLLATARQTVEQVKSRGEKEAGTIRFEAATWATELRAAAEADRQAAVAEVDEARGEMDRLEQEITRRAEEAVEQAIEARELDAERVDRRVIDLETKEIGVVARLRRIGKEIAALVEAPIEPTVVDVPARASGDIVEVPARASGDVDDGVVLDLTGAGRLEKAMQSGLRRGLNRPR